MNNRFSRKHLIVFTVLALTIVSVFTVWRVQEARARARAEKLEASILKRLGAAELHLILKSQADSDPETMKTLKESADARQAMVKSLSETLALAAQARREGLDQTQEFIINAEFKKNFLLQNLYMAKLNKEQGPAFYKSEEVQAIWTNPENEARFKRDIATLESIQRVYAKSRGSDALPSSTEGQKLEKARKEWARTKVFSDKAKADAEFIQRPEIQLRLRIVEAGILASDYLNKHWQDDIKAVDVEIKAYLAVHPEYSVTRKRDLAEQVLQRAKAGEDFSKLAQEFSEDRRTNKTGGLYENTGKGVVWAELESAALALEPGQIADNLIETQNGFHILKLESKHLAEPVKFTIRHILLQKTFPEPNSNRPDIPPPFLTAEEIAIAEIEKDKYQALVRALIERNQITVANEFLA